MKKALFIIILAISALGHSQSFMGMHSDNYSGIHGILYNPGAIADSRTKWEKNMIGFSGDIATDYTNLTIQNISNLVSGEDLGNVERFPSDANSIFVNQEFLGPSFLFSLGEKSGIALSSRLRIMANLNAVNGNFIEAINNGFENDFSFNQTNLDITAHGWAEVGLTYGRVFKMDSATLIKGGITLKYLAGGGFFQVGSKAISGNYENLTRQASINGDLSYGTSFGDDTNTQDFFNSISPGFGADIGFVYEYRTTGSVAPSNNNNPRGFNQYKCKLGISIVDIGSILYKGVEINDFTVNAVIDDIALEEDAIAAIEENSTTTTRFTDVKMKLPTSLHLNLDYLITKRLYVNLNLNRGLVKAENFFNNNRINILTITPRYESRFFGLYLPISKSRLGNTALGAGFRLGPLTVGSGSIISNLMGQRAAMANAFVGLKIPVYHKRKEKE